MNLAKSLLVTLGLCIILTGCSTRAERAARDAAEQQRLENGFISTCKGYGHKTGTAQFNQCLGAERNNYETRRIAQQARAAANWASIQANTAAAKASQAKIQADQTQSNARWSCTMSGGVYFNGTGSCI